MINIRKLETELWEAAENIEGAALIGATFYGREQL